MRNERTSKRIATIVAKVLQRAKFYGDSENVSAECPAKCSADHRLCTIAELKILCEFVQAQAPDRKAKNAKK